jgi:hypothetical protein
MGESKCISYRSKITNSSCSRDKFNHYVLRSFCDCEKDIKIEETIFVMRIKKENELHVLLRKVCFELLGVVTIRYCMTETKEGRYWLR